MPELTTSSLPAGIPLQAAESSGDVQIPFSSEQYKTLQSLAEDQGIELSDAVNQAIMISKLIVGAIQAPEKRVLIQNGKKLQEVTLS